MLGTVGRGVLCSRDERFRYFGVPNDSIAFIIGLE
jgi:hypothetical protein